MCDHDVSGTTLVVSRTPHARENFHATQCRAPGRAGCAAARAALSLQTPPRSAVCQPSPPLTTQSRPSHMKRPGSTDRQTRQATPYVEARPANHARHARDRPLGRTPLTPSPSLTVMPSPPKGPRRSTAACTGRPPFGALVCAVPGTMRAPRVLSDGKTRMGEPKEAPS